ncbi:MAG: hypothetical protein Kow0022_04860 [Phycisphaerales bacterium]
MQDAVGVPFGDAETPDATARAVLTFHAIAEPCAPLSKLVQFRKHFPPSRWTGELGNPLYVPITGLGPLATDRTPVVVSSPRASPGLAAGDVPRIPAPRPGRCDTRALQYPAFGMPVHVPVV